MKTLLTKNHLSFLTLAFFMSLNSIAQVNLKITEIFSGQAGSDLTPDWFEIKNTGSSTWVSGTDADLFYDDDSQDPTKATAIEGISEIKAGEYAIVLISNDPLDVAAFTTIWSPVINLSSIKIGYTDGAGLGAGGDLVTLWLGNPSTTSPIDTASYPATDNFDGLSYDVELASFSSIGNGNQAVQTSAMGGDNTDVPNIASPGNQGPAIIDDSAPSIVVDVTNTTSFLTLSEESPAYVSGVLNDPTDPAATLGIHFTVSDADTPLEDLTVTVTSSNQAVVLNENLELSGSSADNILKIIPTGIGYANITIAVTDTDSKTATYTIGYGASEAAVFPNTSRYHTGTSDGSTAITVGTDYMWVADDENQTIRLYSTTNSGAPLKEINFNNDLGSSTEVDLEGSYRNGNNIYWMGSHTETSRSVIFGTVETENGIQSTLAYTGKYTNLRNDLITWDNSNGHGKGAKHYGLETTLEIEGFSIDPNNTGGALLALRAPLVEGKALLIPVTNLETIIAEGGSANFGSPIELDLELHSFRSIDCNEFGCVIIGGPVSNITDFRLFTWSGNPTDKAELRGVDLMSRQILGSYEGIAGIPSEPFIGTAGDNLEIQLLVDMGTFNFYGDGSEAKALPHAEWKKFKSDVVQFGPVEIPPVANEGDVVITEIMQNPAAVSDNNGEWFELYNTTFAPIDLNGWTISDNGSNTHTIDNGGTLIIAPGAYLVLGVNNDFTTNGGVTINYTYDASFALGNSDDELILKASDGNTIDSIAWDGGPNWPDPNGISMSLQNPNFDNNNPTNWCEATTTYGTGDFGTPGSANDCPQPPAALLQITEIWSGNSVGDNLTADWFEITNMGDIAWVSGVNPDLYYDDESQDPAIADIIMGISRIEAGNSVIIMIGDENDVLNFKTIWSPDYDLTDVEIGYTDGAGLGAGGDGVTLFLGTPSIESIVDFKTYPGVTSGSSYDVVVAGFSQSGVGSVEIGSNIAIATTASNGAQSAIGSPGNKGPLAKIEFDLKITEIFSGQAGSDLTADWFEIKNTGAAPWMLSNGSLYYDDESASATEATIIEGITSLQPNASAIVIIGTENDALEFHAVWSPVLDLTNIEIGYTSGAGLGGGGDVVTLWVGEPSLSLPVDTASYPATDNFDGQSYDVALQAFSTNGNANNAVTTLALAGANSDIPNIGSPGNKLAVSQIKFKITEIFSGQSGSDLTADWFEIKNTSDINWEANMHPSLYYDDESANALEATIINGLTEINSNAYAIVVIGDENAASEFYTVWSPVIELSDVQIGYTDGAGLGGGGDKVTLWVGNPSQFSPIDTASYPATDNFDGKSYDVELGSFSEKNNASYAVATIALGGSSSDVPNIGSPGNNDKITNTNSILESQAFSIYPNPSSGKVEIQTEEFEKLKSVKILSVTGQLVYSKHFDGNEFSIDLSNLNQAIYQIHLQTETGVIVKRITKN